MEHLIPAQADTFAESADESLLPIHEAQESFFPSKFKGFGLLRHLIKGISITLQKPSQALNFTVSL